MTFGPILKRAFYSRPAIEVARGLLGKVLVHGVTAGIIVETEAYLGGDDLASHTARGITDRTRVIFGPPGHAYVYLIYGMYECLNLVAEAEGQPGCVLIRALEPVAGIDIMRHRRPAARKTEDLASGPGKLTLALAITRAHNGVDVTRGPLVVRAPAEPRAFHIETTPRIGITKCVDWPLRFVIAKQRGGARFSLPDAPRSGSA
jgi:DNA-3-methyladenine glycosylase